MTRSEEYKSKANTLSTAQSFLEASYYTNCRAIAEEVQGSKGGRLVTDFRKITYLVAATATYEDYYYLVISGESEKGYIFEFISCVGKVDPVDLSTMPDTVKKFVEGIESNPEEVAKQARAFVDSTKYDVLFTKINIGGKLY